MVPRGLCDIPEGRGIFPNLTVNDNLRIWTYRGGISMKDVEAADLCHVPRPEGAPQADGRDSVRRGAADAGYLRGPW